MIRLLLFILPFLPFNLTAPIPVWMDYTFPAGTTYWTNPYVVEGQVGMTIKGQRGNRGPSRMVYRGPPTLAPIQLIGCTRCTLRDLEIVDESGCDATVLVTNAPNPGIQGFSFANQIINVRVHLGGKSSKRAFSIDPTAAGGVDGNNDHHVFTDCFARAYSECGFYIKGSQTHDLHFIRCIAADEGGRRGIGLHSVSGTFFAWDRGGMNSNDTDFKLSSPAIQAAINGCNSEHGRQFLKTDFIGEVFFSARDVRWEGEPQPGINVIDAKGAGPFALSNSYFSGLNGNCPLLRFSGPSPGSLDASGVMIRQHLGIMPAVPLVTCPPGWESRSLGLKYQQITPTDGRITKAVKLNAVLTQ